MTLEQKFDRLKAILQECGSACVGYSGGVDSVFLAVAAVEVLGPSNVLAVTGLSPAYPEVQRRTARECALQFGIPHAETATNELSDPNYAANPGNRCYYCKSELWPKVTEVARARGLAAVLDGSNADDAHDYRPGFAAAREHGVRAPLLEAGLTKADIRELSRQRGLPTWDQPGAPCLSSRLPYGVAVTPARLRQVEDAETLVRDLGFVEFRVRHHDDCMRLEVAPAELALAEDRATEIGRRFADAGLPALLLDVEGYRRGALNEALVQIGGGRAPRPAAYGMSDDAENRPPHDLPEHDVAGHHRDICVLHTDAATARSLADTARDRGYRYVAISVMDGRADNAATACA
jgi:pyridinium-3,5-biscarboxylic acid mononucleotide sulfurtransferase